MSTHKFHPLSFVYFQGRRWWIASDFRRKWIADGTIGTHLCTRGAESTRIFAPTKCRASWYQATKYFAQYKQFRRWVLHCMPKSNRKTYFSYFFSLFPTDGLKLCDFGFSRAIEGSRNVCEIQGTADYVAPVSWIDFRMWSRLVASMSVLKLLLTVNFF